MAPLSSWLALALLGGPVISPEQRTLASPPAATSSVQVAPAIAFDGTEFVVVWIDKRLDVDEVFAARIMPGLTLLDPVDIDVGPGGNFEARVDVGCSPTGSCLVVWADDGNVLRGARLVNGSLLDPGGTPLLAGAIRPSVAWDGAGWQVAAEALDTSSIELARVTPAGTVTTGPVIAGTRLNSASIACIANVECLVAWMDGSASTMSRGDDVFARRTGPTGALLDATNLSIDTSNGDQVLPSVTADTTQFAVGYVTASSTAVVLRRVSQAGQVDASAKMVASSNFIVMGYDGTSFVALWSAATVATLGRFSSTLTSVGATQALATSATELGDVTGVAGVARVALEKYATFGADVALYELTSGGSVGSPLVVDVAPAAQAPASVAADSTGAAVVGWQYALPDAGTSLATARFVPGNGPTAPTRFSALTPLQPVQTACSPSTCIALVVATLDGGTQLCASRISATGTLVDMPPVAITADTYLSGVATWDGANFQTVWPSSSGSLYRRRYSTALAPIDAAEQALGAPFVVMQALGCIASANGLACFTSTFDGLASSDALVVAPLVPDGGFVNGPVFSTDKEDALFPAALPGVFFTATDLGLQLWAFDPAGNPVAIPAAPTDLTEFGAPGAAFDGDALLVAWASTRAGNDRDVVGELFNADLTARFGPFPIAATPHPEWEPHVAAIPSGGFVVQYRVHDSTGAQVLAAVWLSWCDGGPCSTADAGSSQDAGVAADAGIDGGEMASDSGTAELDAGPPPVPDGGWQSPDGGTLTGSLPDGGFVLPGIVGDPPSPAECGQLWSWSPTITGDPPFAFALRGATPDGAQVSATGTVMWAPPISAPHEERFLLAVGNPAGGSAKAIDLAVACPPRVYLAGCGCQSAESAVAASLLFATLRSAVRRRRRSRVEKP